MAGRCESPVVRQPCHEWLVLAVCDAKGWQHSGTHRVSCQSLNMDAGTRACKNCTSSHLWMQVRSCHWRRHPSSRAPALPAAAAAAGPAVPQPCCAMRMHRLLALSHSTWGSAGSEHHLALAARTGTGTTSCVRVRLLLNSFHS